MTRLGNALRIIGGTIVLLSIAAWVGAVFAALDQLRTDNYQLWALVALPPVAAMILAAINSSKNK